LPGQLGTGDADERNSPHPVDCFLGRKVISVACGFYHTVVLSTKLEHFVSESRAITVAKDDRVLTSGGEDLVAFIIRRLTDSPSSAAPESSDEASIRQVCVQLRAASLLIHLALEEVTSTVSGNSPLRLLSREDALLLLCRTLAIVDRTLELRAKLLTSVCAGSREQPLQEGIELVTICEGGLADELVTQVLSLYPPEEEDAVDALAESLYQSRRDLLLIFSFGFPQSEGNPILEDALVCIARNIDVLFPSIEAQLQLLRLLADYIEDSIRDEIMLSNYCKCAHLTRCVQLFSRIFARFVSIKATYTSIAVVGLEVGVRRAAALVRVSLDVFRLLRTPHLLRLFSDSCVADLRVALPQFEQCLCNFVKALAPLLIVESLGALEPLAASLVEALFQASEETVELVSNAGPLKVGPVLPSALPALLLFGLAVEAPGAILAIMTVRADRLLDLLSAHMQASNSGAEAAWTIRLQRLCVSFCARAAAVLCSEREEEPAPFIDLWRYLQLPDQPWKDMAPFSFEPLPMLDDCHDVLRNRFLAEDHGYKFLLYSIRNNSMSSGRVAALEALVCGACELRGLDISEAWRGAATLVKGIYSRRSRILSDWDLAQDKVLRVLAEAHGFLAACTLVLDPTHFLPPCSVSRLRRVVHLVICAIRWMRLGRESFRRKGAIAVVHLFSELAGSVLDSLECGHDSTFREIWEETLKPLRRRLQQRRWRVAGLEAIRRYLQDPRLASFQQDILESLNAVVDLIPAALCGANQVICSSHALEVEYSRERRDLVNAGLLPCLLSAARRLLEGGVTQMHELRVLRSALKTLALTVLASEIELRLLGCLLDCFDRLFISLLNASFEINVSAIKGAHNRTLARDQQRGLRSCCEWLSVLALRWALDSSEHTHLLLGPRLVETLTRALQHLHDSFYSQPRTDDQVDEVRGAKKRSQELIARPMQFSSQREGLVIQGEKLATHVKVLHQNICLTLKLTY
jgi:hypothetical protein